MTRNRHQKPPTKALDKTAEIIERVKDEATSKQPRFDVDARNARQLFYDIYSWGKNIIFNEPAYMADSRKRDTWLSQVVLKEPYLLGVLQSVVSIDRNRGWTLVGGRNQVNKFTSVLHNFQVAPDLYGWRPGIGVSAQNFYQSDLGAPVEIGRAVADGPLAALYTVDPTKCRLTGKTETPLRYQNGRAGMQDWGPRDYFRVVSFPNPNESLNGLGYCAVSRCIEIAKLMVSVFEHYRERLGSKAPKGILTINGGITLDQWLASLEESKAELKSLEREYYAGVQVLVGGNDDPIKVELTGLSTLPDQFDYQVFVNIVMFGYALAFGYDPREFWPVSGGALGTGKETETQHRKATSKGGLDFALNSQEKLQEELPPTIDFEYEQRDVEGDTLEIALNKQKWDIIDGMYKAVNASQEALISRDQALQLLVEAQLVPEDWTVEEEETQSTDTDDIGDVLERARVQAAVAKYPDEDIVRFSQSTGKIQVLRKAGAARRFLIRGSGIAGEVARADTTLAKTKGVVITESDVEAAMAQGEKRLGKKAGKAFDGKPKARSYDDLVVMVDGKRIGHWIVGGKPVIGVDFAKKREKSGQFCPVDDCDEWVEIPGSQEDNSPITCPNGHNLIVHFSDSDYEDYHLEIAN